MLSKEVSQSQVLETKIFHSPYGTGVAILTGALRFTLATNIDDIKLRRLPEVPGKISKLSCQLTCLALKDFSVCKLYLSRVGFCKLNFFILLQV